MTTRPRRLVSLAHLTMISVPPLELVRAAGSAGFDAVGLRLVPTSHGVEHRVPRPDLHGLRRAADESGVRVLDVEVVRVREPALMSDPRPLIEAAAVLGAKWIITTVEDPEESRRADGFKDLCDLAAKSGVGISLEFMVFSAVPTLETALRLIEQVGAENASVLVDALHHERAGGSPDDLAGVPARLLPYVQLCDAPTLGAQPDPLAARAEAVTARLLPGDGSLPLERLVAALPVDAAISVEAPLGGPADAIDARALARRARVAAEPFLAS